MWAWAYWHLWVKIVGHAASPSRNEGTLWSTRLGLGLFPILTAKWRSSCMRRDGSEIATIPHWILSILLVEARPYLILFEEVPRDTQGHFMPEGEYKLLMPRNAATRGSGHGTLEPRTCPSPYLAAATGWTCCVQPSPEESSCESLPHLLAWSWSGLMSSR